VKPRSHGRFDPGKHDSTVPSVICEVSVWLRTNDADVPDPVAPTDVSPVRKGETTEVVGMTAENICERDMLMPIRRQERKMAVPLSQLAGHVSPPMGYAGAADVRRQPRK